MKKEVIMINERHHATLTCYLWDGNEEYRTIDKRPAVIVIPGGGYEMCSEREADPVATAYFQAGFQVFVLRYSIQENKTWPNPLQDYEDAISMIRAREEQWKVFPDKIAVIGFSAGGHLAGAAATMAKNRPNAAILGYAVLSEQDTKIWNASAPDIISHVDRNTCPCFLFHSRSDRLVPVTNTLAFISALEKTGVTFESHIYSFGPHGFSVANQMMQGPVPGTVSERVHNWVADSIGFLQEVFGSFGYHKMNKPTVGKYAFPELAGLFSVDSSLGFLLSDERSATIVAPFLQGAQPEANGNNPGDTDTGAAAAFLTRVSLRDILSYSMLPNEQVEQLEKKLAQLSEITANLE